MLRGLNGRWIAEALRVGVVGYWLLFGRVGRAAEDDLWCLR
jgi:hypothetical protein